MSFPKYCQNCYAQENTGNVINHYLINGGVKVLCELCYYNYYKEKDNFNYIKLNEPIRSGDTI